MMPMDPIFDFATDLSQADVVLLPFQTPHMQPYQQGRVEASPGKKICMSNTERPTKESEIMKNFFEKILAKTPKFDNMAG